MILGFQAVEIQSFDVVNQGNINEIFALTQEQQVNYRLQCFQLTLRFRYQNKTEMHLNEQNSCKTHFMNTVIPGCVN